MCDGNVGNETGGPYVITEGNRSLQLCQSGIEGFIWGFKVRVQDDVLEFVSKMFDLESCSTWSNFNLKSILRRELSCTVNFFHFLRRWVSKLWSTDTTQKQKFTTVAKSDLNVEKNSFKRNSVTETKLSSKYLTENLKLTTISMSTCSAGSFLSSRSNVVCLWNVLN